jgi:hypothetical protein
MQPELTNERAEREWQWLCDRFGTTVVLATLSRLPGKRRPFPLNVARALRVTLPPPDKLPPLRQVSTGDELLEGIAAIRAALGGK